MSSNPQNVLVSAADSRLWFPHVTVATVVPRDGRFLFVEENVHGRLVINQPAGHLEPDETLHAAAVRETLEETGWDVELECLLGIQQWKSTQSGSQFVRFTFGARALHHDSARPLDTGIVRALWLSRDELADASRNLRSPLVLDSVDDWISGRRFPLDTIRALAPGTPSL
jgi:8-oxo-dGTP pyrophosphatase MutT (NUDIX family)